jgi:hypothetical protein
MLGTSPPVPRELHNSLAIITSFTSLDVKCPKTHKIPRVLDFALIQLDLTLGIHCTDCQLTTKQRLIMAVFSYLGSPDIDLKIGLGGLGLTVWFRQRCRLNRLADS